MAKKEVKESKQKSHYFKDMKAELKKVIWPTPKQLLNNTIAVIAFTIIIAVIVFVLDLCFDSINTYGITALQEKIQTSYQEAHPSEEESADTSEEDGDASSESSEDNVETDNIEVETESNSENDVNVETTDTNVDANVDTDTNNAESQE